MSYEWLHKGELSSELHQICSTHSLIHCFIRGALVMGLYNPMHGANIISSAFALTCLEEEFLISTVKSLNYGSRSIKQGIGIVLNMAGWHNSVVIPLNFHIFEDIHFDVMIGHPIEKFFLDETTLWKLGITLLKENFFCAYYSYNETKAEEVPQEEPTLLGKGL